MYWRFDLKIREQFTVWQTILHILINVYWNEYGLIKTDATTWHCCLLLFLAWLITESVYNDAFHTFTFSMQQCIVYMTKKNQDNSFNFRFQNWERSTIEKTPCKHGENFSFPLFIIIFFFIKTRIQDFLLDIYFAYKSFVWTAALGLEFSGSNDIVLIFAFILVI